MQYLFALWLFIGSLYVNPIFAAGKQTPPSGTMPLPAAFTSLKMKGKTFKVEVVTTPEAIAKGLMFRKSLPQDEGMLFVFPQITRPSFWMKNTFVSLDIIFIDEKGMIVWIYPRAKPGSEKSLYCPVYAKAALEVLGGTAEKLKIDRGDYVEHAIFKPQH